MTQVEFQIWVYCCGLSNSDESTIGYPTTNHIVEGVSCKRPKVISIRLPAQLLMAMFVASRCISPSVGGRIANKSILWKPSP